MKVAIVHDQLQEFGGAERVLVALKKIFPEAPVYTSFYSPEKLGHHAQKMKDWEIHTSWAQKVPFLKNLYSPFRFIAPLLWESFNFNAYDVVISSSGAYMSKGIVTRPETVHICYIHHPPRSLYYYDTPIEWQKHLPIKIYGTIINHNLRMYDFLSSQRVDHFITNSRETKKRVEKFYRRDSEVIYPPVEIPNEKNIDMSSRARPYYLSLSRLARTKHMEVLIDAAKKGEFKLKIVGEGRDLERLKSLADSHTEFLGSVHDDKLLDLYNGARAFLFAAVDEEFGIAPIEAMAHGLPVIAYKSGGVTETIQEGKNGYLFNTLTADSLLVKMEEFEKLSKEKEIEMRKHARTSSLVFSEKEFEKRIKAFIAKVT